jgi:flagellar biosynthetic protein FliR
MEVLHAQLPALLAALWWPFCRVFAMLSASPILGENLVPVTPRVLLSLVLGVVMMPLAKPVVAIDPFSLHAVVATLEQLIIGFEIGLAFHLVMAVAEVLGFMISSQMGLSMAVMNDPLNGTESDVVSAVLSVLYMLLFFAIDGHLVLAGVVGASFHAWPVGAAFDLATLRTLAYHVAWVFSASLLLAVPVMFSALVVQIGFGFLNRVAPALNLYSLGFAAVTLFGLYMLGYLVRFVPDHYVRMTNQALDLLRQGMR